ncbi:cysteine synthase A [Halanaerobium congolense]|jgi:cysteine synthase A|uniref:Cysteine synthase n=1 Tax=Halanaerobium congolense TaxID=54121 RepID=A0A1G6IQC4_9FIRM|nr:cysteine synthase A [Halanaerobium congolense]KXS50345.1 MAG: cysteine synthase A [Halanaerobium sp. T82-1]OEG63530.1 MAG: cysteine synthase A [Halanaerobium sp. MDAL1]PUU89627.1 MAG: cysteine synthase A [Halanaerobium sp.]PTX15903.1 cysteine synthase A [Halanaerobium congolense]PXV64496.1 cysteine synthase A [Halanaerobium congolense]
MIFNNVTELIGNTPLVRLNSLVSDTDAEVVLKLESFNPGGSIKDRIAFNMISEAEKSGEIEPGGVLVEPTSGNTGIGIAMVGAAKGYKVILTMPESMSEERKKMLKAYGAELVLTPASEGMKGAISKAKEISAERNGFIPSQFDNPANPDIHRKTTAEEIITETHGKIDYFVAGVGTGGTITGTGEKLKEIINNLKVVAVEPENSAVISGEEAGPHKIQGIGAGFIPGVLNTDVIDRVEKVKNEEAFQTTKDLAVKEGIFAGISTGAAVAAALRLAKELDQEQRIVVIAPDTGERYLSTGVFA